MTVTVMGFLGLFYFETVFGEPRETQHAVADLHVEAVRVLDMKTVAIFLWVQMLGLQPRFKIRRDVAIDAEIDLCNSGDVYFLRARLNVSLPGMEREVAQAIVDATHDVTCAYSNATRGNIDVTLNVV